MLGADDVLLIFAVTMIANLGVEVGAEVVAEWWVNGPGAPPGAPDVDPSAAAISPDLFTEIAVKVDQTAQLPGQVMTLVNGHVDPSMLFWSAQMTQTLGSGLGLQ
jgi:hypothetical protein